ncbi:MAG: hypothetical protein KC593_09205 [Myxococcales bacterium]|jgi:hypothetical protein|nr:hypothetical protein [Myxococcales bacterium]MCB9630090.1 hypothetical protein [Sandaracinaceae bacterium]
MRSSPSQRVARPGSRVRGARCAVAAGLLALLLVCATGCVADGPPFTRCAGGAECAAPADGCYELLFTRSDGSEGSGRQCTLRCAVDQDCPEGAACLVLEGDPTLTPLCFATCALPEDCYRGSRCTPVEGPLEVMSVCLP